MKIEEIFGLLDIEFSKKLDFFSKQIDFCHFGISPDDERVLYRRIVEQNSKIAKRIIKGLIKAS